MLLEYLLELNEDYKTNLRFGAYDLSDKLTVMLIGLLVIGSATTSYKFYINSPLMCFTANNPTGENFIEFATNYIWAHGSIPASSLNQSMIEGIDEWQAALKDQGIHYYQWVPVIFLLQSLTLLFVRYLWQSTASTGASYNLSSLLSKCVSTHSTIEEEKIKEISSMLLQTVDKSFSPTSFWNKVKAFIQNAFRISCFSRRIGNWMSSNYILYKILIICIGLLQAFTISRIFNITPLDVSEIWSGSDQFSNRNFPRSVIGFVPDVAVLGSYNSYTVNCIMSINLINEKLFILIQSLLIFVAFINLCSLISWTVDIGFQCSRIHFIKKYLLESNPKENISRFVNSHLKCDGVFMLRMIKKNCDNHLVRRIINNLWTQFNSGLDAGERFDLSSNPSCSSDQILQYLTGTINCDGVVIIDPFISHEVLDSCGSFDTLIDNYETFRTAKLILAPISVENKFWVLFVYDTQSGDSFTLNPFIVDNSPNDTARIGSTFTSELNKFRNREEVCYKSEQNIERFTGSGINDSGPIICGYATHFCANLPLTSSIDVRGIRKTMWEIRPELD